MLEATLQSASGTCQPATVRHNVLAATRHMQVHRTDTGYADAGSHKTRKRPNVVLWFLQDANDAGYQANRFGTRVTGHGKQTRRRTEWHF